MKLAVPVFFLAMKHFKCTGKSSATPSPMRHSTSDGRNKPKWGEKKKRSHTGKHCVTLSHLSWKKSFPRRIAIRDFFFAGSHGAHFFGTLEIPPAVEKRKRSRAQPGSKARGVSTRTCGLAGATDYAGCVGGEDRGCCKPDHARAVSRWSLSPI